MYQVAVIAGPYMDRTYYEGGWYSHNSPRYVKVRLERKQQVLDTYHKELFSEKETAVEKESKSKGKNIEFGR